jgi:hypothetical protein
MSQTTLTGSGQNRHALGCSTQALEHTDKTGAGVVQGLNHRLLRDLDGSNPPSRLFEAGASARAAVETPGRGCWKKRTPSCNGTDRSCNITALREQAHFQQVVHYETTGRTDTEGKSQMNAQTKLRVCILRQGLGLGTGLNWPKDERHVRRQQAWLVKATRQAKPVMETGSATAGL